jgi:uncharacterized protein YbaR (Trm112 family)
MKCPHCGVRVLISNYGLKILKCPICKKPLITKKEILSSEQLSSEEIKDVTQSLKEIKMGKCKTFANAEELINDLKGKKSVKQP